MKNMQKGFTLIELMIVIAIIGILASIAIPSYQNYTKSAKFTEVIQATNPLKKAVDLCAYDQATVTGCDSNTNNIPAAIAGVGGAVGFGKYVSKVEVKDGKITATAIGTAGAAALGLKGETYILTPTIVDGKGVEWEVSGTCIDAKMCKK
jgi:type IV pilus assembly protein PilA